MANEVVPFVHSKLHLATAVFSAVRRGIFVESQTVLPGLLRRWRRPSAGGGCGLFNVYGHLMILQGIWTRREVIYRVRGVIYRLLEGV